MTKEENRVKLCPDGVYRWIYELDMYKNPVLLMTVFNVLFIGAACVALICTIIFCICGGNGFTGFDWEESKYAVFAIFVFLGVTVLSYFIVAKSYGGKYMVLFEMTYTQITHYQMDQQFDKAQAVGWLLGAAGLLSGNFSMAGAGLLSASRNHMTSVYRDVRKIRVNKTFHVIKLNGILSCNQIYVGDEDFDFVADYLRGHINQGGDFSGKTDKRDTD